MNMLEMLTGGNNAATGALAQKFGLDEAQANEVLRQIMPAISTGMKHQAQSDQGRDELLRRMQQNDLEGMYERPDQINVDQAKTQGNQILGQIFGSKEVSREVANRASLTSGVSSSIIKAMLPVVVSMVMGGMQRKQTTNSGGLGDLIGAVLGGAMGGGGGRSSGGGGMLGSILGSVLSGGGRSGGGGGGALGSILGGLMGGGKQRRAQPELRPQPRMQRERGGYARNAQKDPMGGIMGMLDGDGDGRVDDDVLSMLMKRR